MIDKTEKLEQLREQYNRLEREIEKEKQQQLEQTFEELSKTAVGKWYKIVKSGYIEYTYLDKIKAYNGREINYFTHDIKSYQDTGDDLNIDFNCKHTGDDKFIERAMGIEVTNKQLLGILNKVKYSISDIKVFES